MAIPIDLGNVTWLNLASGQQLDAGELRRADAALVAGGGGSPWGGIARHSDTEFDVTVNGSDVVTVQPGAVVIPGNAVAESGIYRSSLDAAQSGSLAARNATNPRIDLLIFRAMDTDVVAGHAAYKGRIELVTGTPAASPSAPALPTMAVELARITVPQTAGGAATVDTSFRTYATAAGGTLILPTAARAPASAAKWQRAVTLDNGRTLIWDGSSWTKEGASLSYTPAWLGGVASPVLGNGTLQGRYREDGEWIDYTIRIVIGSTTNIGSGLYTFGLPFAARTDDRLMGHAWFQDASGAYYQMQALNDTATTITLFTENGLGIQQALSATTPVTLAVGDRIDIKGRYERA